MGIDIGNAQRAGIDHDLEIRAAVQAVDRVGCAGISLAGAVGHHRDNLASGREPHDADAGWIDVPFLGPASHQPHGALAVLSGVLLDRVGRLLLAAQAVLENERGHANAVQIPGRFNTLGVVNQQTVAAARDRSPPRRRWPFPWAGDKTVIDGLWMLRTQ